MKFKFFLLGLFVLLMCSGCTVEYNLDIDKALNLNESITIQATNGDEINDIASYDTYLPISIEADDYSVFVEKKDNIEYYEIVKEKDNTLINFDYSYNVSKFNDNYFARSCYKYVTVMNSYDEEEDRNELLLSTSSDFLCFDNHEELESVTIRIHTEREVYSSNADSVDGNNYIWHINRSNNDDATINMVMDGNLIEETLSFWEKNLLFLIAIGIFILGGIIFLVMKKRSDKINEI